MNARSAEPDCHLCSWPQSGRTWLRFMLAAYFNERFSLGVDLDLNSVFTIVPNEGPHETRGQNVFAFAEDSRVPQIIATHKPWRPWIFADRSIMFLIRSPHDTLVSKYRGIRWRHDDAAPFERFLLEDERGLLPMCQYLNSWAANLQHCRSIVVSYEQLSAAADNAMERLLEHLHVPIDARCVRDAVQFASYDNMKRLNQERGIGGKEGPRTEEDLLRVREGVVGSHKSALTPEQNEFISGILDQTLTDEAKALVESVTQSPVAASRSM